MSYTKSRKIAKALKEHGDVVESEMKEMLADKSLKTSEVAVEAFLEEDFGPNYRHKIQNLDDQAMEAIVTAGTFNKMIQTVLRHTLTETPREEFKAYGLVSKETAAECDGKYRDFGVFSDYQAHEVNELEAGPLYGVATDFMDHPDGKQASNGIAWTREALCRDPNRYLQSELPKIRQSLDLWREEAILDVMIGYKPTFDRSGTLYNTYYANGTNAYFSDGTNGPWINADQMYFSCSQDLTTIKNMFWDMTDMVHGRTIDQNIDSILMMTSRQQADRIRPLLLASAIECDKSCAEGENTCKYVMTAEVANGITFNVQTYNRLIDRIVLRYGCTRQEAQNWMFIGFPSEFMAWVTQIPAQVTRCPLGTEECRKRIVAVYSTLVKGYAYVKNQYKMVCTTDLSTSSSS